MTMLSLGEAAALVPGAQLVGDASIAFGRVHTDTRTLRAGDLFVALRGERFDAHDFLAPVREAGAVAAIAERGLAEIGLPGLQVGDTRAALAALASGWRRRFELPLIAVTGSNGKTTVTQMIASILHAWRGDAAFATAGNLNNHIGVPLMLLRLRTVHTVGVLELGMNHPGEIAALAAVAAPTVALVNNAQREHQEFMASVEAVAHENGAAIEALADDGIAVFSASDGHAAVWREQAGARRTITFVLDSADGGDAPTFAPAVARGAGKGAAPRQPALPLARAAEVRDEGDATTADVSARARPADGSWALDLRTPLGDATAHLAVAGRHNLHNALAAATAAIAVGCPLDAIVRGLEAFRPVAGRSDVKRLERAGRSVTLVDDSYNANPDSVRAAIDVLAALPGPRWLVLGDMGEVGDAGPAFHHEVGAYARARGIETLWTVGTASTHAAEAFGRARHFDDMGCLLTALADAPDCASIVVKGSRFMQTERVVAALLHGGDAAHERPEGVVHAA